MTLALLTLTEYKDASSQLDFIQVSDYTCLVTLLPSASTKQMKCKQLLLLNRGDVHEFVGSVEFMLRKATESEGSLMGSNQEIQKMAHYELVRNYTKVIVDLYFSFPC